MEVDSDDDDSDDEPAPKAKAKAKAKPADDNSDDDSDDAPAPKAKAAAKKMEVDSDDDSDDVPAPKAKAAAKAAADDSSDDEEMPAAQEPKKKIDISGESKKGGDDELTVFVGGLSFGLDEATVRKDFTDCGEIEALRMPTNEDGKIKGFAFITFKNKAGCEAALKFNDEEYGGRRINVNMAGDKKKGEGKGKDKGKGKDGKEKGKQNNELTVFIRGLPFGTDDATLRKDFEECGEMASFKVPKNEEGTCKGIAFIEYKTKEGFEAALKFEGTEYGGRTLGVQKAGDGPPKGKDGKDKGKGKGKDGKGKKGKKGKEGGLSEEKFAAKSGAMVESTGTKATFNDSDDSE